METIGKEQFKDLNRYAFDTAYPFINYLNEDGEKLERKSDTTQIRVLEIGGEVCVAADSLNLVALDSKIKKVVFNEGVVFKAELVCNANSRIQEIEFNGGDFMGSSLTIESHVKVAFRGGKFKEIKLSGVKPTLIFQNTEVDHLSISGMIKGNVAETDSAFNIDINSCSIKCFLIVDFKRIKAIKVHGGSKITNHLILNKIGHIDTIEGFDNCKISQLCLDEVSIDCFPALKDSNAEIGKLSFCKGTCKSLCLGLRLKLERIVFLGGDFNNVSIQADFITLELIKGSFDLISISATQFNNILLQGGEVSESIYIASIPLGNIIKGELIEVKHSYPKLIIDSVNLDKLQLSQYNIGSSHSLRIQESNIESIEIGGVTNLGRVELFDISNRGFTDKANFKITNSDLGKISLNACDFSHYQVTVDNSNLTGMFYTGNAFPKSFSSNKTGKERNKQLQDTYSQMETVSQRNGQYIDALNWRKLSNNAHFWYLLKTKSPIVLIKRIQDVLVLGFSWLFGIYGTSVFLSLFMLAVTSIVCFAAASFYAGESIQMFGSPSQFILNDDRYIDAYFQFLNPTHKYNLLGVEYSKMKSVFWYYVFDFLGRASVGYSLFQFIKATRKFSGK
ncbi:hypothetical protein [Reichenbachiella agariperforans]|uniref:hypothetical protein n=1 Tax=Reichenbachiella agariperforans TaxID=156994 RepID=UPI001C09FB75|nr:hypothetical protein [Reichenbachiella agariperforans]MBU2915616.1 hypothetical protein [Reichenbachiella agariperforans]